MSAPLVDTRVGGRNAPAYPFIKDSGNANMVSEDDKNRYLAYQFYDDVYHNRPETFKTTIRGTDGEQKQIYLPSGGTIVEAVARFLGVEFDFVVGAQDVAASTTDGLPQDDPQASEQEMLACQNAFIRLFKREQMYKKFEINKRYGLVRGDQLWHITADDLKSPGRRISVHMLHPGQYFPIYDPVFGADVIGCHLVSTVNHPTEDNKKACQRQTYRKVLDGDNRPTGAITSEVTLWEIGKWDDRNTEPKDLKKLGTLVDEQVLPPEINSLPVYHIRNSEIQNDSFGLSELSGFETLFNGANQSMTDEDMSLVMAGLGMFWTNAPPPMDADGNELSWEVGPGQVIEVGAGHEFGRLTGVATVAPFQEHIDALQRAAHKRIGLSDIAIGDVDATTAESGIARMLKLAPILAHNFIKEQELIAVMDNMLFDLATKWFPAYEQQSFGNAVPESQFGDPLPIDRKARIEEILSLVGSTPPMITIDMAQTELAKLGYQFSSTAVEDVFETMARISDTLAGGGAQAAAETDAGTDVEEVPPEPEETE